MEHSKLPWNELRRVSGQGLSIHIGTRSAVQTVCSVGTHDINKGNNGYKNYGDSMEIEANAAFIVTACNEHDTLKAENAQLKTDNEYHIETIRIANEGIDTLKAKAELFDEVVATLATFRNTDRYKDMCVGTLVAKAKELK